MIPTLWLMLGLLLANSFRLLPQADISLSPGSLLHSSMQGTYFRKLRNVTVALHFEWFHLFIFLMNEFVSVFFFNCSTTDWQCFRCTTERSSYTHAYLFFSGFFSIIAYCKILTIWIVFTLNLLWLPPTWLLWKSSLSLGFSTCSLVSTRKSSAYAI